MAVDIKPDIQTQSRYNRVAEKPLGELLKELKNETTTLARQEIDLAKTELSEKAQNYVGYGVKLSAGGAAAAMGGLIILLAVGFAVSHGLIVYGGLEFMTSLWLGPLIVGVIVTIVGLVMLRKQISNMKKDSLVPNRTLRTLEEDQQWLKQKLS